MRQLLEKIKLFGDHLCDTFGFDGFVDFTNSLIHKKLLLFTLPTSFFLVGLQQIFGIPSMLVIAFVVTSIVELVTGVWAAMVKKQKIRSRAFSRFGLKLLSYVTLIYLFNMMKAAFDGEGVQNYIMYNMFNVIHHVTIGYISLTYAISILENYSVISGKPKSRLLLFLYKKLDQVFELGDGKSDDEPQDLPTEDLDTVEIEEHQEAEKAEEN